MKEYPGQRKPRHRPAGPLPPQRGRLIKVGFFSFIMHISLLLFLSLNLSSMLPQHNAAIYRVTLSPFSTPGSGSATVSPPAPQSSEKIPVPSEAEKPDLDQGSKGKDVIEKVKPDSKKMQEKEVSPSTKNQKKNVSVRINEVPEGSKKTDKEKKVERGKDADKSLHEAIEGIRKRVALRSEEQKQTSQGLSKGEGAGGSQTAAGSSPGKSGSGKGAGAGEETSGTPAGGSKADVYSSLVWAKIKKEWTLPENFSKAKVNLETIIVVAIDKTGKIQKSWFEKKSGNTLYDQMAMWAIIKAEPFPPIPNELRNELRNDTLEIGIRFYPE